MCSNEHECADGPGLLAGRWAGRIRTAQKSDRKIAAAQPRGPSEVPKCQLPPTFGLWTSIRFEQSLCAARLYEGHLYHCPENFYSPKQYVANQCLHEITGRAPETFFWLRNLFFSSMHAEIVAKWPAPKREFLEASVWPPYACKGRDTEEESGTKSLHTEIPLNSVYAFWTSVWFVVSYRPHTKKIVSELSVNLVSSWLHGPHRARVSGNWISVNLGWNAMTSLQS